MKGCAPSLVLGRYSKFICGFLAFSRSPNPPDSGTGPVTWPRFTEQDQAYLVLSLKPRVERSYEADKIAFWNEIVPKIFEFAGKEKKETDGEKALKDEL